MTRVLFVAPMRSHPQNQGNCARLFTLALELKQRNIEVDLVYYGLEGLSESERQDHEAFWSEFHFVPSMPTRPMAYADCWGIDDWCPEALCDFVGRETLRRNYDAVIVNYVWMSRVFEAFTGPVKILDTHDLFGARHVKAIEAGLEPQWFFTTIADENRAFDRADVVIGIQANESATIGRRTSRSVKTVGHTVAPHFLLRSCDGVSPVADFGYIGSSNQWNIRSLKLLDAALVGSRDFAWCIAGGICNDNVVYHSGPIKLGRVGHLDTFYRNIKCVINPMVGGTGLKIKTIEALSYGKQILGTKSAFDGIATDCAFHALADPADFPAAMQALATSAALMADLKQASINAYLDYQYETTRQIDDLAHLMGARAPAYAC